MKKICAVIFCLIFINNLSYASLPIIIKKDLGLDKLLWSFILNENVDSKKAKFLTKLICRKNGSLATFCENLSLGEAVCRAGGGDLCNGVDLGEGICRANNGALCKDATVGEGICRINGSGECNNATIAEGICFAGGGSFCKGISLEEGLCKAFKLPKC